MLVMFFDQAGNKKTKLHKFPKKNSLKELDMITQVILKLDAFEMLKLQR